MVTRDAAQSTGTPHGSTNVESAASEACWCCGEPAPIRGEGDPWESRLDGYCESCATTRCDTTDSTCAVKKRTAAPSRVVKVPDLSVLTPRELAAAVTPLFELPGRFQKQALNELVIRCEVAERLLAERDRG